MSMDKAKQQARLAVIQKLRAKGAPGPSVAPAPMAPEEMGAEAPEETLNDMGIAPPTLRTRLRKKKQAPLLREDLDEYMPASEPQNVTGGY